MTIHQVCFGPSKLTNKCHDDKWWWDNVDLHPSTWHDLGQPDGKATTVIVALLRLHPPSMCNEKGLQWHQWQVEITHYKINIKIYNYKMKVQHRNPKPYATRILNTTLRILTHMDDMTSPRLTNTWEVLERAHLCLLPSRNFHSLQEESSAAAAEAAQGFDATGSLSQIQFGHRLRQAWVQKSPRNACLGRTLWLSSRRPPPSRLPIPSPGSPSRKSSSFMTASTCWKAHLLSPQSPQQEHPLAYRSLIDSGITTSTVKGVVDMALRHKAGGKRRAFQNSSHTRECDLEPKWH